MRLFALSLLLALAVPGLSRAADAEPHFKLLHVADLVSLQKKDARVQVYDANHAEFREENGVLPGAHLLSSFNHYDVAKELPKDKATPLVFYCANAL
jgi:hypothetical protein